jgi:S1-C subfamily serine protease
VGQPYEPTLALARGPDEALREVLAIADGLGAGPLAAIVRRRSHERGARGVPRRPTEAPRANPNRFVSAARVISAGHGSQYGPLCLRNAAGTTYRIDKIIKYSNSEDYVVFSVLAAPVVVPLETRSRPPLNTPVFAVGNALGEGVVVRDGLYTSDTPEELEGRWQWLRFSAAASPGNSGGPLIDRNGKVVGVVVRKSPNENLNFASAANRHARGYR